MLRRTSNSLLLAVVVLATTAAPGFGQLGRPKADVTTLVESDGVRAGTSVRLALHVVLPDTLHVQSDAPRDPLLIPTLLTIDPPEGVVVEAIVYPEPIDFEQVSQDEPLAVFSHDFAIGVQVAIAAGVAPGDLVIPARLRYQACDEHMCFPPATVDSPWTLRVVPAARSVAVQHADVFQRIGSGREGAPRAQAPAASTAPTTADLRPATPGEGRSELDTLGRFTMLGTTGGYLGSADFLQFIGNAERGVEPRGLLEGRGLAAMLLIVFLGGLALNLTPCVLPMIPINIAIIGAGVRAGSRVRGFLLGSTYGSAMALVYGVLGVVVVLTAGSFGAINASPWFNAGIAIVFVALGLAMFDVWLVDFSRFLPSMGAQGGGRSTFALAFTMGGVAALLAGACVAPVVIQVVLFSSDLYASGFHVALALPFVLGLGMALPWPFAGAGIAALPKPGPWMARVKQAFGVLILATAAYYGHLSYTIFANRWVDPAAVASSMQAKLDAGWRASLAEGLAVAEREGKPVLVDLWATWCKNCLTMDKTTFEDPTVLAALSDYVKIKVQAEDPDEPTTRALMQHFRAVGLPTYVILRPADTRTPESPSP